MSKSLKIDNFGQQVNFVDLEKKVLEYWDSEKIFEKSVDSRPDTDPYVFYDGPPFATGLPHYGHLLGSIMKDIVPRYWTMKGKRVERRWGWDCHGLPIENIIEQELGLQGGKKGIEAYGIANFNDACRSAILRFDFEWEKVIHRIGRWVDMKHSYKTMDPTYMESVWWAFKQLYDKELVYEGKKVILYCPRCATPLSNFEIAMDNSYKDVTEDSTTYKFPVKDNQDTYLLAWSTTPWNKLATPALAVNPDISYVKVRQDKEFYILAENRLSMLREGYEIIEHYQGIDLEKLQFTQLYDFYPDRKGLKAGIVVADEFVTAEEGTGIVTLAVYGEEDYRVMQKHHIQLVEHIDDEGKFRPQVTPWAGMFILKANKLIDADLQSRGLIYEIKPHTHSVPTCYRCGTRLYYAPLPAWFINIQQIKTQLISLNQSIHWYPEHLKSGRFGKGLETAPDWNISRSRYWGTPMPVWVGVKTGKIRVIGSLEDLKTWAVEPEKAAKVTDIHRQYIDDLEVFVDDQKTEPGKRIKEVFDCWVESGSMPYASEHYPFENRSKFEARFPAQFICEYIAQTRAWFYTLHVMSTALFGKPAFQHALTTGTIMAEDGTKMSKSKRNFPDPMKVIDDFGVDALRLYFASSPIMKTAENVNFSQASIDEIRKKILNIAWNVFSFLKMYDQTDLPVTFPEDLNHVMDKWLALKSQQLQETVTSSMDQYDVVTASRALMAFVDDLSNWFLRLSRERIKGGDKNALMTLKTALNNWMVLIAPFTPFITETMYQNFGNRRCESIHLELLKDLPQYNLDDKNLIEQMAIVQVVVNEGHRERKANNLGLKQPLAKITIDGDCDLAEEYLEIIKQELNVKSVELSGENGEIHVTLDTVITKELAAEGLARRIIRDIQSARKAAGTRIDEFVVVELPLWPVEFESEIMAKVKATKLVMSDSLKIIRN